MFSGSNYSWSPVIRPRDGTEMLWRRVFCRASSGSSSWQSVKKSWGKWMYLVLLTSLLMQSGELSMQRCCMRESRVILYSANTSTTRQMHVKHMQTCTAASSPCLLGTTRTARIRAPRLHVKRFCISHNCTMAGTYQVLEGSETSGYTCAER